MAFIDLNPGRVTCSRLFRDAARFLHAVPLGGLLESAARPARLGSPRHRREREDAADALRAAFAVGCIHSSELAERAASAYSAVTRDELHGLVSDLPSAPKPPGRARLGRRRGPGALGWEFSLMLAAAGSWLITAALPGVAATPFIMLWLVALRALGMLPRLMLRVRDSSTEPS